jgi:hypothetical protein
MNSNIPGADLAQLVRRALATADTAPAQPAGNARSGDARRLAGAVHQLLAVHDPRLTQIDNAPTRHALEDLHALASDDTAQLERALAHCTLLVATWAGPDTRQLRDLRSLSLIRLDSALGERTLALFTGADRLRAYCGAREAVAWPVPSARLWQFVALLGQGRAMLDPGHLHARAIGPELVAKLARGQDLADTR